MDWVNVVTIDRSESTAQVTVNKKGIFSRLKSAREDAPKNNCC